MPPPKKKARRGGGGGEGEGAAAAARASEVAAAAEVYAAVPGALGKEAARLHAPASSQAAAAAAAASSSTAAGPLLRALLPAGGRPARRLEREAAQYEGRLRNKVVMLDNPVRQASRETQRERARAQSRQRARSKVMPSAERKRVGLFRVGGDGARFELYEPLHALWLRYVREVCAKDMERGAPLGEKLSKADMHGAIVSVARSTTPGAVGAEGIVVQETQRAFRVVTRRNRLLTLLKPGSVFRVHLPGHEVLVFGRNFCVRPPDRASKKLKARSTTAL